MKKLFPLFALLLLSTLNPQLSAAPLGTAFTYQGRLIDGDAPANGIYDFWFKIYDDPATGTQQGVTVTTNAILIVTHNYNADTNSTSQHNTELVGVWYYAPHWTIYNENNTHNMAPGRAFNVLVIKP